MTRTQLEYAFAKVTGLMMGEDTVVFNNEQKTLSVYNLRRFNLLMKKVCWISCVNSKTRSY